MNLSILYKKLTNRKYTIWYKFILSLFVWFVSIISFCSADYVLSWNYDITMVGWNVSNLQLPTDIVWIYINSTTCTYHTAECPMQDIRQTIPYNSTIENSLFNSNILNCSNKYFTIWVKSLNCTANVSFIYDVQWDSCDYSDYVSLTDYNNLLSEYNYLSWQFIILQNNYNNCQSSLNSCQSNTSWFNDLLNNCSNSLNACNNSLTSCLQQNCPETITGTNRSSLFINNIQYPWAPTIKFTIPEEIERDQNTDEEETNIDVIWYGYDQDKMQQMVNTQYYKPTAEEMSWLMEKIADFLPLVAVALLIARIRRVIKKVF